jgi:hypothetical protein
MTSFAAVEIISLVGLAIYLSVPHAKISEAGRIVFSWATLALVLKWVGFRF